MSAEAERDYWDSIANHPRPDTEGVPSYDVQEVADYISERLTQRLLVLDLGCGPGRLSFAMARLGCRVVGLDISNRLLDAGRFSLWRASVHWPAPVFFVLGDGRIIPEWLAPLYGAYSVTVFQHLPPDAVRNYISQVARRLVPGGVFVFQYVAGDGKQQGPLAWEHDTADVKVWCEGAGLSFEFECAIHESWAWITARKGSE